MTPIVRRGPIPPTALVFLGAFAYLYWARSHNFVMIVDEGIFLDGSRRILEGQVPYRDFFILMGPGSFWLQAASLKLFGMTLAASRMVMILDLSIITACVFWLIARQHSRALAGFVAAACVLLESADPGVALPNHRWDSAAMIVLAVTLLTAEGRRWFTFAAGGCAAFAAWITPPVLVAGLTLSAYLWRNGRGRNRRDRMAPFLIGGAAVSAAAVAALGLQGALIPLIRQMLWTGSNYSRANFVPYGFRLGGYEQLFQGAHGADLVVNTVIVLGITLPAILPIAALFLWWPQRRLEWGFLLPGALALLASTYPRLDVTHLTYAAPLFYVFVTLGLMRVQNKTILIPSFILTVFLIVPFVLYAVVQYAHETAYISRAGKIRASRADIAFLQSLEEKIQPGSGLFVFPYLPILYFMTLTENPTRYSYLQPGMMSDEDESTALAELRAQPGAKVLYYDFSESGILRIWPNTDPSRLRLFRMEQYLLTQYREIDRIQHHEGVFKILERLPDPVALR